MALLSEALATARTWLNDDAGTNWTDGSLIPKAQEAHRELQVKLWNVGSPAVRKQSAEITITAGATTVASAPADILTPFKIQEYAASAETLANATDMTEVFFLPNKAVGSKLDYWAWKEEAIALLGASVDRKIVIYYRKKITIPVLTTDQIGILFGELYIGARTAAMAYGSAGNKEAYAILSSVCKENFDMVVAAHRGQQTPLQRP